MPVGGRTAGCGLGVRVGVAVWGLFFTKSVELKLVRGSGLEMLRGDCTATNEKRVDLSLAFGDSDSVPVPGLSAQLTLFAGAENLFSFLESRFGRLGSTLTSMLLTDAALTLDAEDAVSLVLDWPESSALDDDDEDEDDDEGSFGGTAGASDGSEDIGTIFVNIDDILPLGRAGSVSLFKEGSD